MMNNQQADHLTLLVRGGGLYGLPTSLDWTVREFFMRVYLKKQVYSCSCTIDAENKLLKLIGEQFLDRVFSFCLRHPISIIVKMCHECFIKLRDVGLSLPKTSYYSEGAIR